MWRLPKDSKLPIYQTIMDLITHAIRDGQLLPGERLPAERKLAEAFQVNRSTVVHALEELSARGVLIRKRGSGTTVNDGKWGLFTEPTINWRNYLAHEAFTKSTPYLEKINEKLQAASKQVIDAYTGELPMELLPSFELPLITWKDFLQEEEEQDMLGYVPLRESICLELLHNYQCKIDKNQLLVTSGAQQALFLLTQVLLQSGDAIAIEEPSFFYPLPLFQAAGIRLYGIPMDQEGIQIDILDQEIVKHKIKMLFITPNFQNPTGHTMSFQRRKQLIELCKRRQVVIVEDDVFARMSFETTISEPPLKKLDPDHVIYIGSLSKILGATTKIGWISAPSAVVKKLAEARQEMDFTVSIFPQVLANYALRNEKYETHLSFIQKEVKRRRDYFVQCLEQEMPKKWKYQLPSGGFYLWLTSEKLNPSLKEMEVLLDQGLLVMPSQLFGMKTFGLRINFARLHPLECQRAVKILSKFYKTFV